MMVFGQHLELVGQDVVPFYVCTRRFSHRSCRLLGTGIDDGGRIGIGIVANGSVDKVSIHLCAEIQSVNGVNIQIAIGHHVGTVAFTSIEIVAQGVNERVDVFRSSQRALNHFCTYFIDIIHIVIVSVWRAQLHTSCRRALVGRILRTAVGQLEVDTSINPLMNLMIDIRTQRIAVAAGTLLPLVAIFGIT